MTGTMTRSLGMWSQIETPGQEIAHNVTKGEAL